VIVEHLLQYLFAALVGGVIGWRLCDRSLAKALRDDIADALEICVGGPYARSADAGRLRCRLSCRDG
jgi:hypothetical protein